MSDVIAPVPARRPLWPWVLGGSVILFAGIVTAVVIGVMSVFGAFGSDPARTVQQYDDAYRTADCQLYKQTLSEGYIAGAFGDSVDCLAWAENARAYTVDGTYLFHVEVTSTVVDGDTAQVVTHETDSTAGSPQELDVRYDLVKENGAWVIDDITSK